MIFTNTFKGEKALDLKYKLFFLEMVTLNRGLFNITN